MAGSCDSVVKLLGPYVDDELAGSERAVIDEHLRGCKDCQGRLADLQATHAAMSAYFTAQADAANFAGFTQRVMAQVRKEPLPFAQRAKLWWAELMAYHSAAIYSAFGAAAVATAAAVFVLGTPAMHPAANETVVHSMSVTDPRYEPVVMHTEDGETVMMLVEHQDDAHDSDEAKPGQQPAPAEQPHGGNL
ncbi:MAG: zf-HC2 domain-containing protein [Deltaproteobacteria bacterium]|nr:zf-HC2 domain-containing protein [Deltaproteobacteria bacterium]